MRIDLATGNSGTMTAFPQSIVSWVMARVGLGLLLAAWTTSPPLAFAQGALSNGSMGTGTITVGQSEVWTFPASPGQGIMIRVGATNFTPKIQLFDPSNAPVADTTSGNTSIRDGFITARAAAGGTYSVQVGATFATQAGSYAISVATTAPEISVVAGDEGGAMTNGLLHQAAISLGDLDVWNFTAAAGDGLMLRMGSPGFTPWIRLYAPSGELAAETTSGNTLVRDGVISLSATNAGLYTVIVSAAYSGQSGVYRLTLARSPGLSVVAAGDEGGTLTNGVLQQATLPVGDLDLWHFAAAAGDSLMLRLGSPSFTPWIRVYDPAGVLAAETTSGNSLVRDGVVSLSATNSGTYTVVASATYSGQSGDYLLSLAQAPGAYEVSSGDQGGLLTNGQLHSAQLALGDLDLWHFAAAAGDSLMLRLGSPSFTPWIRVYDPAGVLAAETTSGNSLVRDGVVSLSATNSGTYTVVASATYSGQSGDYLLSLAQAPGAYEVSPEDQGGLLTNGQLHAAALALGDLDLWTVNAKAGDGLLLRVGSPSFTPWVRVFGPDGKLAAETTSGNTLVRDGVVSLSATNAGEYTVVVSATFLGQSGNYSLSLAQALAPIVIGVEDHGGDLFNGATNAATLAVGDIDLWSFHGTPGDSNILRVVAASFTPWLRLYGPTGALVAETTSGNTLVRQGALRLSITNAGTYTIAVSATFSGQSGPYTFKQSRVPPDLNVPATQVVAEGSSMNVTISAQDPDEPGKPLQFALLSAPPGVTLTSAGATNALISWNTTEEDGPSTNTVVATVTDVVNGQPFSRTNSFDIVVEEINTAPQLTLPGNQTLDELTPLSVTAAASDADLPANPLTFALVRAPAGMTIDPNTGAIHWMPTEEQGPSVNTISVVVTDESPSAANAQQMSTTNTFTVTVREVNLPPQLTVPPDAVVDELQAVTFLTAATDADRPNNTLTFSLLSAPAGLVIDPANGTITWLPSEAQGPSTNTVTVKVDDHGTPPLSASATFTLTVREINTAPALPPQADQQIDEGAPWTVINAATDSDLPASQLTYTLLTAPDGATISPAGEISWTPTEAQGPSTNTFTTVVTDSGTPALSATNRFVVVVRELNTAPVLEPITDRSLHFGTPLSIQAAASDSDLPGNRLSFTLEPALPGLVLDAATGAISWTASQAQVGVHLLTLRVSDNGSPPQSATATFQVTVVGEGSGLAIERLPSGLMQIRISGDIDHDYELEESADLRQWNRLVQFRLTASPFLYIDPAAATRPGRFYRLRLTP